jgi:undecaprenyl-diphosphatase
MTHCVRLLRDILVWIQCMFDAIILGMTQGITEFLPVSSSGHLVIFRDLLALESQYALAFDAILHLATLAAVVTYFHQDLQVMVQTFLRSLGRLPVNRKDLVLLHSLLIATLPAVVIGYFSESLFILYFNTAVIVASFLCIAALFFAFAEWKYLSSPRSQELNFKNAFYIGMFQALAILPGFSRSGMTIVGGMLLGLSRYESARFSFLLAIPITAVVGIKKLIDLLMAQNDVVWSSIMVGAVTAYLIALVVIHFFLVFIRKYTLWPFIWYSFILAGLILVYHFY